MKINARAARECDFFVLELIGVAAMNDTDKEADAQLQRLRDAFEGVKRRRPNSDMELKTWLATDEGRQATIFESTELFMWGEMHAGAVRDPTEEAGFRSDQLHE